MPVYIVHALDEVRAARDRGAMAFAETCPQYLFLSLDDLGNGFEGMLWHPARMPTWSSTTRRGAT